jgi:hypothetical protein
LRESNAIADYLNLGLRQEELNETVRESATKIYSELVQGSAARFDSPFVAKRISRTLGTHDPNDCSFLEIIQYESDGQSSKKRKLEEDNETQIPKKRHNTGGARVKVTSKPPKVTSAGRSPLKIIKWAETPAQRAFRRDTLEYRVLDTRQSDLLECGELGEMVRVSKHKSPFIWDGSNCGRRNVRADQIAEGYMVDVQLGWKIINSETKKDAYQIGCPNEAACGEYKLRTASISNRSSRRTSLRTRSGGSGSVSSDGSGSTNDGVNRGSSGNGKGDSSSVGSGNDQSDMKSDSQDMVTTESTEVCESNDGKGESTSGDENYLIVDGQRFDLQHNLDC